MKKISSALLSILLLFGQAAQAADKPLVIESGQVKQLPAATSLQLQAPTTANATINLPHGTAPTSPADGDCWTTTAGLYCRINGATVGPFGAGSGSVTLTGDVTGTGTGSFATTLATVNANTGAWGSATQVPQITLDGKGRATAAANVTITPAASSITGGAALTKTDDTNVTLTLGGSPTTALLAASSITAGWTGQLAVTRGGTGLASIAQGDLLYGSAANTLSTLAKNTTASRYLSNAGTSNNPSWAQVDLTNGVTGRLPFANLAQGSALSVLGVTGNATADNAAIAAGSDNQVLRRSGTALAFGAVNLASSSAVTGTLATANGGTGTDVGTAWTTFTPTATPGSGSFTTVSTSGRYKQMGKTLCFSEAITITTNGTAASWIDVSLPVDVIHVTFAMVFVGTDNTGSGTAFRGASLGVAGLHSTVRLQNFDGTYPGATGAILSFSGCYEAN